MCWNRRKALARFTKYEFLEHCLGVPVPSFYSPGSQPGPKWLQVLSMRSWLPRRAESQPLSCKGQLGL